MSEIIIATFTNQFMAAAARSKLLSYGMRPDCAQIRCEESVGGSAASSSNATSVVSRVSDQGTQSGHHHELRAPATTAAPQDLARAELVLDLRDNASEDEVRRVLELAGAVGIQKSNESFVHENPAFLPELGLAKKVDVDRAIDASRLGASLTLDRHQ
jgi:hypothetical protein